LIKTVNRYPQPNNKFVMKNPVIHKLAADNRKSKSLPIFISCFSSIVSMLTVTETTLCEEFEFWIHFETEILGLRRETVQRDVHRFSSPERRPTLGRDARGHHKEYSNLRLPLHQQQQHLVRKTLLRLQGTEFESKN
jgi:hypothetical protein